MGGKSAKREKAKAEMAPQPTMRGNLADLAATGLASEPTLRKWIAAQPDQDWIIKRGSNGDAYEIDIAGAVQAFRAEEEIKAQAARERAVSIRQIAMDLGINDRGGEDDVALSIAERRQLLEEEVVAIKLSRLRGELVSFVSVQAAVGDLLVKHQQRASTFGARLAKKIDLTREQITAIDRMMEADLAELADALEKMEREVGDSGASGDDAYSGAQMEDTAVSDGA